MLFMLLLILNGKCDFCGNTQGATNVTSIDSRLYFLANEAYILAH
jgi:hypothetical protein